MLFNSYHFLLGFCPIFFLVFFWLGRRSIKAAVLWLGAASLGFYAWWNPAYLIVIVLSIAFNFVCARLIQNHPDRSRAILSFGVVSNVLVLCYFKYDAFLLNQFYLLAGDPTRLEQGEIPLGISFFTFVQIAYLVDAFRRETASYSFAEYTAFVTYFPHLIAGPIIHHRDVIPLFREDESYQPRFRNFAAGITLFTIGLFKKTMIADRLAPTSDAVFTAVEHGAVPGLAESWVGTLAYTLQIYFDFSAYSDMALGLSLLIGIRLPMNFYSPYQATNIIDFWRRWHISLSNFLRDYIYIPLGGNRSGKARRYINLMLTMLIGGIWHGAGWTFLIWGGLHGLYLVINHGFRAFKERLLGERELAAWMRMAGRVGSVGLTFVAVAFAWVFFRATDLDSALQIVAGLLGMNGVSVPAHLVPHLPGWLTDVATWEGWFPAVPALSSGLSIWQGTLFVLLMLPLVFFAPNAMQLLHTERPGLGRFSGGSWLVWRPNLLWALIVAAMFLIAFVNLNQQSVFLYFQF